MKLHIGYGDKYLLGYRHPIITVNYYFAFAYKLEGFSSVRGEKYGD